MCLDGVGRGFEMSDLPGAIHLVPQTPILDPMWVAIAMRRAQIGVLSAGRRIAVFDQIGRILDRACTHVDAYHRLSVDRFAKVDELVRPKLVRLNRLPGEIATARARHARADSILP